MEHYGEFLDRSTHSEFLQYWMLRTTIKQLLEKTHLRPEDADFLEIGIGLGRGATIAAEFNFKSYTGVEPSPNLAKYCRDRGIKVIEEALPALDGIVDQTYDVVFMMHVLEHAPNYVEARKWMKEALRTLKTGGVLVIASPNILDYKGFFWNLDWSHGYPTTPARIAQISNDLEHDVTYSGSLHLGQSNFISAFFARVFSLLIPTRIVDSFAMKIVGRPLASNLKVACLWGLSFVVTTKK